MQISRVKPGFRFFGSVLNYANPFIPKQREARYLNISPPHPAMATNVRGPKVTGRVDGVTEIDSERDAESREDGAYSNRDDTIRRTHVV